MRAAVGRTQRSERHSFFLGNGNIVRTATRTKDPEAFFSAEETGVLRAPQFTPEELQEALRTRNGIPLFDSAVTLVLFFVPPLALYLYPSMWIALIGAIVNIHTFNRSAQIVHGSDHNALFANRSLDSIVGRIAGCFLGYQRLGHKETHDEHHFYLNSEKDADRVWCEPEARVGSMLRGWLRDLFLVSAVRRFLQYIPGRFAKPTVAGPRAGAVHAIASFGPIVLVQAIMLLAYTAAAAFDPLRGVAFYLLVFIAPLFILYPVQIRLRSNVEHSFIPGYQCRTSQDRRVVRSVDAMWLERTIIAPLNGEYHYEHHLVPRMPYYNAPRVREILRRKGASIPLAKGYISFVWRKWRMERVLARRAQAV
jgi:fatty acid desaturase